MLSELPAEAAETVSAALGMEEQIADPAAVAEDCIKSIVRTALDERITRLASEMEKSGDACTRNEYMKLVQKRASLK